MIAAREASYKKIFFVANLYPVLKILKKTTGNRALIHAIVKQESGFLVPSESSAGAKGFMQIIPPTAKILCKELNINYNGHKLKHSMKYNIILGNYYLEKLMKRFNSSKILVLASYNAGPEAANRWIDDYGDPRVMEDNIRNVVDWIESISYRETRNYVQRVLENLMVYEHIFDAEK
ncbi:hypothetical protein FACS1894152_2620 [Bacilli bacterium]|nr:hypothetical protein FACS1894152_2620 [Bacilli bacterium]